MSLGQFKLHDKDTRLIKYKDRVYKVKVQYRNKKSTADDEVTYNQDVIQSEMEAAIRAVLAMPGDLHSFRTEHFLIHPERKYWNTASLLKFFEHGHELRGDPHMIYLTVENIPDHLQETRQTQKDDGAGSKRKSDENESEREGTHSGSAKKTRTTESAAKGSRLTKRGKSSQQVQENDSESTTDVNSSSDHERPNFHSPPHKHRRYALRKKAASQPHAGGEPSRGKRMLMLSREKRFMIDGTKETSRGEVGGKGSQKKYQQQASLDDIPLQYAATASNRSQPAHPQGGVLQDMYHPSPNEIAQHQLEEQMRLERLAGPSNVNRSHPAFSAPSDGGDAEAAPSALRKLLDVVLTPAKKLFIK